ncbi:MAG: hypothetical protein IKS96_07060 [Fibrobacter sp.]|nr:hypothetical protein [Fibrobacter sp.]MBR6449686.1 hypothetical protein [Fibrobacter sp.]
MLTMKDYNILKKCNEVAERELAAAASLIAEKICERKWPEKSEIDRYRIAKISAQSTRNDLDYCMTLELHEILSHQNE